MNGGFDALHATLGILCTVLAICFVLSLAQIEELRELAPEQEIVEVPVYPPLEAFNLKCYIIPEDTVHGDTGKS